MYKEGDAVKKVCNSNTWEEINFVTPFICANSNYNSVDFDVTFTYNEIELCKSMVWKSIDARFCSNDRK